MRRAGLLLFLFAAAEVTAQSVPSLRASVPSTGSPGVVRLDWTAVPNVTLYQLRRTSTFPNNWTIATTTGALTVNLSISLNTAAVFQVTPVDNNGVAVGASSNYAIASNYPFAATITAQSTIIAASHITELRSVLNAVRASVGLAAQSWFQPSLGAGSVVMNEDMEDLRTGFNGIASALGLAAPTYTDPGSLQYLIAQRAHIQQIRGLLRSFPETVWLTPVASNPYFSPNGDNVKDTTVITGTASFSAASQHGDFHWILNIRNSANAIVRTAIGNGVSLAFSWDGRNGSGALQPDGAYTLEVIDADTQTIAIGSAVVRLDNTAPGAAIASPANNTTLSNIRQNGSGNLAVTGSATDTNFGTWTLERTGNAQSNLTIANGTTAVPATAQLGVWQSLGSPNGNYVLRLSVTDAAGNNTQTSINVTVGHFSALQDVHQLDVTQGQAVRYTSSIPFTVTERLTIKNAAGAVVKTLIDGQRPAGTYNDDWNGTNDAGQLVGDGVYRYFVTVIDGANSMTWDESGQVVGTGGRTQLEYVQCRDKNGVWKSCAAPPADFDFDPYANKPLRIRYCVGGGTPPACVAGAPANVIAKVGSVVEITDVCDSGCFLSEYQSTGPHEFAWYGWSTAGAYAAGPPYMTVIRQYDRIDRNATVVYGTPVTLSVSSIQPLIFNPAAGTTTGGQDYQLAIATYNNRQVTVQAQFRNAASGSILRTITVGPSAPGTVTVHWDGRADNNAWVAPGQYQVIITATDSAGGSATIKPLVNVRY